MPDHYHSELLGITAHQDFQVIKTWELDADAILREGNLVLLPLMPLMRGADEGAIRQGAQLLRQAPGAEGLETVLGLFARKLFIIIT